MATKTELEAKFWKALKKDMTLMLGVEGVEEGHAQPMTAMLDDRHEGRGPVWFFTAKDNGIVAAIKKGGPAIGHFVSKDHELFACMHGKLALDNDRAMIEHLWNPFVAAWFKDGKDDPKLQLIRFDTDSAEIWLNENSMFAGIKLLLGSDPKKDYKDKVAEVSLK